MLRRFQLAAIRPLVPPTQQRPFTDGQTGAPRPWAQGSDPDIEDESCDLRSGDHPDHAAHGRAGVGPRNRGGDLTGKIIRNTFAVQLATGPVEPGEVRRQSAHRWTDREHRFQQSAGSLPVTERGWRRLQIRVQVRAERRDQGSRLGKTLVPLLNGDAVHGDPAANAQLNVVVTAFQRADQDAEVGTSQRAAEAQCPGIAAASVRFQICDPTQGRRFRSTGHRAGRKRSGEQPADRDAVCKLPGDGRYQMPKTRERLKLKQVIHCHSARSTYLRQVVAHQVDDHDVLRRVLGRGPKDAGVSITRSPRRRALDRLSDHCRAPHPEEQLGTHAEHCSGGDAGMLISGRGDQQAAARRIELSSKLGEERRRAVCRR